MVLQLRLTFYYFSRQTPEVGSREGVKRGHCSLCPPLWGFGDGDLDPSCVFTETLTRYFSIAPNSDMLPIDSLHLIRA